MEILPQAYSGIRALFQFAANRPTPALQAKGIDESCDTANTHIMNTYELCDAVFAIAGARRCVHYAVVGHDDDSAWGRSGWAAKQYPTPRTELMDCSWQ
jgi:hypothetical protein